MVATRSVVPSRIIAEAILWIRGHRVILDEDLAALYATRFPSDFMFQLTTSEFRRLRSQFVISNGSGGRRHRPYAFTEEGVAMLSSVLRSRRAVRVNVEIMRAFVRLRRLLASHQRLARRLDVLEKKYDSQFRAVFEAIRQLMIDEASPKRRIGFGRED